jgi:SAM-dependent methyltransferase
MEGERRAAFIERLRQEETAPFTGWDFSRIAGRMTTAPLPWSFESLARDHLRTSRRALDLGTGGGQRLAALLGGARRLVFATEGYAANVPAARARLAPLDVPVIASNTTDLPFLDARFDLVMSRRTGLAVAEVARVLMPAGRLLTEQIAANIGPALRQALGQPTPSAPDLTARLIARCKDAGLRIEHFETADGPVSFSDIGALVYFLRAMPWIFPAFSVADYVEPLLELQDRVERDGALTLPRRVCLLLASRAI